MIISHKYKYIFFKSKKTASTSVHQALAEKTGPNDIVNEIYPYEGRKNCAKNYKDINWLGYEKFDWAHITPKECKEILKKNNLESCWNYFKFTICRNPFDEMVSRYFYQKHIAKKEGRNERFAKVVHSWCHANDDFYVNDIDFFIRYEQLDKDYKIVCKKLGIPYAPLPRMKIGFRPEKVSYKDLFTVNLRKYIEKECKSTFDRFGYKWN